MKMPGGPSRLSLSVERPLVGFSGKQLLDLRMYLTAERCDLRISNGARDIIPPMSAQLRRGTGIADPPIAVDWALEFGRPETSKAYAYWDSIRGERAMPARSELSPRGMREFLAYVNLVNVQPAVEGAAANYQISLESAHTRKVFGQLALHNVKKSTSPERVRLASECFELVRTAARPARVQSPVTVGNQFWLDSESLLAPLGDQAGQVTAIMWVFVTWEAVAR